MPYSPCGPAVNLGEVGLLIVLKCSLVVAFLWSLNWVCTISSYPTNSPTFRYLEKLKIAYTALYILCGVFFVLSFPFFCGFRRAGVRAGAPAASRQALIGNVEKGSTFSCCQSIGTTCLGTGLTVFLFLACGISSLVIFAVSLISKWNWI